MYGSGTAGQRNWQGRFLTLRIVGSGLPTRRHRDLPGMWELLKRNNVCSPANGGLLQCGDVPTNPNTGKIHCETAFPCQALFLDGVYLPRRIGGLKPRAWGRVIILNGCEDIGGSKKKKKVRINHLESSSLRNEALLLDLENINSFLKEVKLPEGLTYHFTLFF